jgi:nitrate reductase gamma subunit
MADLVLYIVFPYVAVTLAVIGGIYRYFGNRFSFSSLSSQLLEHRVLFWGVIPWHYGIVPILLAHLLALVVPGWWGFLLDDPIRLTIMELIGMVLGFLTLAGIIVLLVRRLINSKVLAVTSVMDWLLLALLLLQVSLGVHIAFTYRWGSLWYLHTAVPWLRSLAILVPDAAPIIPLPAAVRAHLVIGFVIILLFPFTRLVHIFTFPIRYLLRPWQVVIWNRRLHA